MEPGNFRFGGGASATVLHPLVAVWMLIAIVLILTLPRQKAIAPFLLAYLTIPIGQVLVLAGVHLLMHQILILVVLGRMLAFRGKEGKFPGGFSAIDRVSVLWALSTLIIFNIEYMETQALVKSLGDMIVNLGGYLAVRFLIPDLDALRRTVRTLAVICVIHGVAMVGEVLTRHSIFAFVGCYPEVRDGHVRACGVIGAGFEGAMAGALIPLFIWLWKEKKSQMAASAGLMGAVAMIFASHASSSWGALGGGLLGLCFWPLRKQMRAVRWGLVAILTGLHLVMNGPVWSLIEKVDFTSGSSSYHRYMLVDNCIRHFTDWCLIGYKDYPSWGFCMFDLCDQWVAVAVTGGLVTFALFIMMYSRSFAALGNARKHVSGNRRQEWMLWCFGSALFSNVIASFGINFPFSYLMFFFPLLACIFVASWEAPRVPAPQTQRDFTPDSAVEAGISWDLVETPR